MNDINVSFECGNCSGCLFVKKATEQYEAIDKMASMVLDQAFEMTPEVAEEFYENMTGETGRVLQLTPEGPKMIESAADMLSSMRERSDDFLEFLDMQRTVIQSMIGDITGDCNGPLKMRASKSGQIVTATVCMYHAEEENGETKIEPVLIDRRAETA